eukprot:CAMPEP_0119310410 /NCGR_PEP_ID=MMETSP1333-20130426/19344_1 /TAXON_ID=418940 /ORGANISM="Scyphosphaera apsteinii, Strain RCC1455" /LENGTH=190 /DNA_ID=CAMNT_0007314587 /DNA_START=35 /DNA_END=604 /DNA_ORIENTATION=-
MSRANNQTDQTRYVFGPTMLSWNAALAYCVVRGGTLAQINSPEENTKFVLSDPYRESLTWIGANDMLAEGVWRWVGDVDTINYSNWRVGEPSNSREGQHCAAVDMEVPSESLNASLDLPQIPMGQWVDRECSTKGTFACQITSSMTSNSVAPTSSTPPLFPPLPLSPPPWLPSLPLFPPQPPLTPPAPPP